MHRYLEKMTTRATARSEDDRDVVDSDSSSRELKLFLTTEFSKVNESIRQVDSTLTLIERKLGHIEQINQQLQKDVATLQQELSSVDKSNKTLKNGLQMMEVDFTDLNRDFDITQSCIENLDNLSRKNNLRLRGLKESAEGHDLKSFTEQQLVDLDNSNAATGISVESAYRVGPLRKSRKTPHEVVIKFPDWETKLSAIDLINQNSGIKEDGTYLNFFSDFSKITLQKC